MSSFSKPSRKLFGRGIDKNQGPIAKLSEEETQRIKSLPPIKRCRKCKNFVIPNKDVCSYHSVNDLDKKKKKSKKKPVKSKIDKTKLVKRKSLL